MPGSRCCRGQGPGPRCQRGNRSSMVQRSPVRVRTGRRRALARRGLSQKRPVALAWCPCLGPAVRSSCGSCQHRLKIDPFPTGEILPPGPGGWLRCVVSGWFSSRRATWRRRRGNRGRSGVRPARGWWPGRRRCRARWLRWRGLRGRARGGTLGLVDEAGDEGDGGDGVAQPRLAAFGELVEGLVDEVVGVVAAARPAFVGHQFSPSWRAAGMRPRSRFLRR